MKQFTREADIDEVLRHGKYEVSFLDIGPELAQKMLETNTHNRPLRKRYKAFARDMEAGNWQFNGDSIRFSETGILEDGQHRLRAIVESGTTQTFLVITGLPDIAQRTMDQGTKRTVADQLHLEGEANAELLAAISGLLVTLEQGLPWARTVGPTLAERARFISDHPDIRDAVVMGNRTKTTVPAPPSALGAAYWLCMQRDRADAGIFYQDKLANRLGFTEGDPALALLRRFERNRDMKIRLGHDEVIRFCCSAWNSFRQNKPMYRIQAPKGGWTKDNFPTPI